MNVDHAICTCDHRRSGMVDRMNVVLVLMCYNTRSECGMMVFPPRNVVGMTGVRNVPRKQVVEDDYVWGRSDTMILDRKGEGIVVRDNVKGKVVGGEASVYVSYVFFLLLFLFSSFVFVSSSWHCR